MAVYVDESRLRFRGKEWCHLVADSLDELHAFAERLGLRREWFQHRTLYPHYDVTVSVRSKAMRLGALAGEKAHVVSCAKALRLQLNEARRRERASAAINGRGENDYSESRATADGLSLF